MPSFTITKKLHPPEIKKNFLNKGHLSICKYIKMPRDVRLQFSVHTGISRDTKQQCNLLCCTQSALYPCRYERIHLRAIASTL